jgi:TatA/E family protein of Tat protein translocase
MVSSPFMFLTYSLIDYKQCHVGAANRTDMTLLNYREISQRIWYDTDKAYKCAGAITLEERSYKVLGLHLPELLIILGIALAIFGPKTLQSVARNAGKGVSQAKNMKDKVLAELPEEVTQVSQHLARVPTSPQQAVQMLMAPEKDRKAEEKKLAEETPHPV